MIGFVMIGTNDLNKATKFYDALLEVIDLKRILTNEKYIGYSSKEKPKDIEFYVTNPVNREKATYGNGAQISFLLKSRETVDKFYNLGIKLGGKDEGAPGIRSGDYYCYLRDLDGNKICSFAKMDN
ncbi:VOC family protein [Candidatus Pelagibacter sp. Uisw_134_02]|jgi:predicted lactoylglutathione lyase|uniref:VOC family protein n=1 Tax=Candidatus Pelagibacter sp. Uisw_134_02 TaxID=3230990 RepID=UPI0039EC0B40|tara:strand:+ start:304 stop:681 length:378 start_codon:yes stop_codon:yes gene_type:complete